MTKTSSRSPAAPAASLIAGALVVPLVFWIGVDESFVAPKLVAASIITTIGVVQLIRSPSRLTSTPLHRVDLAVMGWIGLVALSFATSIDRSQSWWGEIYQRQGLFTSLLYGATYLLARLSLTDIARVRLVLRSVAVAATGVSIYAVMQRAGLDPIWDDIPAGRVFSTIGQTNSLGAFLALSVPLTVGLALAARHHRVTFAAAATLQTVAVTLTVSRGAFVGLLVAAALSTIFMLGRRGWQWQGAVAVTGAVALALLVVIAITPGIESTAGRVIDKTFAESEWASGSIRNHMDLWIVARHVIADNPVIGTGPDTFPLVFGDYRDDVLSTDSATRLRPFRVESPHNITLATAAGSGVPAAIAQLVGVAGALVLAVRRGWTTVGEREATLWFATGTAVIGAFLASMFITADFTTTWLSWILIGAIVGGAGGSDETQVSPQARRAPSPG